MAKNPVRLPSDFTATVKALLKTPPPPAGDPSTRKQQPKKKRPPRRSGSAPKSWRTERSADYLLLGFVIAHYYLNS